jgi:hypothetical protein
MSLKSAFKALQVVLAVNLPKWKLGCQSLGPANANT